jgi:predicted HicB family RNase H-like nuclease
MTASVMMTLRVDPQLKRALERRARAQGRSVSAGSFA